MRKLCLGLSFAAMILLVACGSESGTEVSSELPPGFSERISSNGDNDNDGESSASGNKNSSATEGTSSDSSKGSSSGSDGGESADNDASIYDPDENTLTDLRDGQVYRTTTIDISSESYSEVWMAENLNYRYPGHTTRLDSSSFCYDDEPAYCDTYGRLYLWSAAMDSVGIIKGNTANGCGHYSECTPSGTVRGVCPKGWHVPSYDEWNELITAVGGFSVAGKMLKSETGWQSFSVIENADAFGFSALPGGYRYYNGDYYYEGNFANFWSSTGTTSAYARRVSLLYFDDNAGLDDNSTDDAFSVRCLKD